MERPFWDARVDWTNIQVITPEFPAYPKEALHVFIENKFVFNTNLLQRIRTQNAVIKAELDILSRTKTSQEIKLKLVQNFSENQANTRQLKTNLVIVNLEVEDGLTNETV